MAQSFSPQTASSFEGFDISKIAVQQKKSISNSVSGFTNQVVNPIKSTISDLQSGIALIKDTDKQIMNKLYTYKSTTIDMINDYMGSLTGGKISIADFGRVISYKDGFKVDSDELMRMASKTLGFNIGNISGLKDQLADEFLNELNSMTLGLSDGLFQQNGDRVTISGDWDKNIGESVFNFLSSGDDEFKTVRNFSASNAILNTMVKQNAAIGFVEGYRGFGGMYLYQSDYFDALISTIPTLLSRGDVNSLDEILKILDDTGRYAVTAKYPEFVETVLSNFQLPANTLPENYEQYKIKLVNVITKIAGENWMMKPTFMGDVINVGLVSKISDDSKTILQRVPEYIPFLCVSGMISKDTAGNVFKTNFPDAVTF